MSSSSLLIATPARRAGSSPLLFWRRGGGLLRGRKGAAGSDGSFFSSRRYRRHHATGNGLRRQRHNNNNNNNNPEDLVASTSSSSPRPLSMLASVSSSSSSATTASNNYYYSTATVITGCNNQQQYNQYNRQTSPPIPSSNRRYFGSNSTSTGEQSLRSIPTAAISLSPFHLVQPLLQQATAARYFSSAKNEEEEEKDKSEDDKQQQEGQSEEGVEEESSPAGKSKIPRGFENFFPPNARCQPPTGENENKDSSFASINNSNQSSSKKEGSEAAEEDKDKKKDGSEKKQQQNDNNQQQQQQQDENFDNLPGLLALLALIVSLRSWLENEEAELGQEITFVEFRNRFLNSGQVEVLQIVNKKMARVILKSPDTTGGGSADSMPSSPGTGGTATTTWKDDDSTADLGGASSSVDTMMKKRKGSTGKHYYFYIGSVESLEEKLAQAQQHLHPAQWVEVQYVTRTNYALEGLKSLPLLAFLAAIYFGSRGAAGMGGIGGSGGGAGGKGGGMGGIFSIGKSTAKKINKEEISVTFSDVAGCEQAKLEIMEFVDFLKDSSRFTKLGAKIPKGALLCGPPGTGKTLLARAVAGESGVPFYSISGSDFIEMFVGVGPSRVRDLFKEARANAPCIVFIDEIDAVGRQRGRGGFSGGGNDERENTLNQLLVEMDGFSPTTGVVVLAGTNRIDILDQALTRPGRFDRQIVVDRPDLQGRKDIFEVHLKGITLEGTVDEYAGRLAGLTPGFAGADIANICNEAAIVAARRKADAVSFEDFEKATDRIIGGLESNKIMSTEERSIVAHHEAGHAIAGWFLEHADPLLKVTIIPRTSGALGFAQYLPKEVFLRSQEQIMDLVCMALAGRAAEEVFFGRVTTGASDDLQRVTKLVYGMIKDFGMNHRLGQLSFPQDDTANSFGDRPYSDSTAEAMDEEARSMVDAAYKRTVKLIREHKNDVDKLASLLLEKETITHDDIYDLVGPRPFESDSAYEEFVSHRAAERAKKDKESSSKKDEEDTTTTIDDGDGTGLTPGLA